MTQVLHGQTRNSIEDVWGERTPTINREGARLGAPGVGGCNRDLFEHPAPYLHPPAWHQWKKMPAFIVIRESCSTIDVALALFWTMNAFTNND